VLQILLQMGRLEKICFPGVCRRTIQYGYILAVVLIAVAHTDPVCIMMRIVLNSFPGDGHDDESARTDTNRSQLSGMARVMNELFTRWAFALANNKFRT
jgi:hypothetical protein